MAIFSRHRPAFLRQGTDNVGASVGTTAVGDTKGAAASVSVMMTPMQQSEQKSDQDVATSTSTSSSEEAGQKQGAQRGVEQAEAVTASWSKTALIAVFLNIWMLYFVKALQNSVLTNLLPFVTSDFESHSLLNVIYVVANAITAAVYIPMAKTLDIWGRAEGFLIMAVFATLGMVLMAVCQNLATFCAAYVFYTLGFGGMTYCVDVITADISRLKNRGLAYAFTSSPYMITAFAGPSAAEAFYYHVNWRWGFGSFAIIFPVIAAPLFYILKTNLQKARKQESRARSGRTLFQSITHYINEFDVIGVVAFSVGLTVFLLPFSIAESAPNGWSTGYIIAMIVVGLVVLVAFAMYEAWLAPVPMLKFGLLSDRTVVGACLLDATYQISYYCWANYFTSFLQVVNNLSLNTAGYVGSTFDVVSGFLLFFVGWLIRRTGHFKWLLYISVPLYIFAQGLMIYFRRPNQSVGYLVMCQVFISIGGSIFIIVQQIAVLAAVDHQHVATALALLNVVGTVGGAMGSTISGAIWTGTFYSALGRFLPSSDLPEIDNIYNDLNTQLSYDVGSDARLGIQMAYGYAQTRMLAAGVGVMGLAALWVLLMRNIDVRKVPQVKGMVF